MPIIDPTTLSEPDLEQMLRTWADGAHSSEAAVNLIINARTWLARADFRRECVVAISDAVHLGAHPPMATIRWAAAARYAEHSTASRSETALLRLACSLAGVQTGSLRELTAPLDPTGTARLIDALAHRDGWHISGITYTTDGSQEAPDLAAQSTDRNTCIQPPGVRHWLH